MKILLTGSSRGIGFNIANTLINEGHDIALHYNKNKSTMSSREYAETLIPTMRSWSETVFKTALEKRSNNEINQIVDQFYNAYLEEVTENPSGHAMDYIHIVMDIEKKIN